MDIFQSGPPFSPFPPVQFRIVLAETTQILIAIKTPDCHNTAMTNVPKSAFEKVGGLVYFARMLDKIRLHARDALRPDFHVNLGKGGDNWCTGFLRVSYPDLRTRVLQGGSDEEILEWCQQQGRRLNETDILVWNQFATKLGWNDMATPFLQRFKKESNLTHRDEIVTMFEYFEVDEGRKA